MEDADTVEERSAVWGQTIFFSSSFVIFNKQFVFVLSMLNSLCFCLAWFLNTGSEYLEKTIKSGKETAY